MMLTDVLTEPFAFHSGLTMVLQRTRHCSRSYLPCGSEGIARDLGLCPRFDSVPVSGDVSSATCLRTVFLPVGMSVGRPRPSHTWKMTSLCCSCFAGSVNHSFVCPLMCLFGARH